MRDESNFRDAMTFDPFRGLDERTETHPSDPPEGKPTRNGLTDSSDSWLVWGSGRILCPGRFYATMVMKLVVAHIVTEYDVLLPESPSSRSMQWRSAVIPKCSVSLLVKRRERL